MGATHNHVSSPRAARTPALRRGRHLRQGWRHLSVGLLLVVALVACGDEDGGGAATTPRPSPTAGQTYEVSSEVVTDPTTREVQVWAPVGDGPWPVVFALPGVSGHKDDLDRLGPALAARGVVVLASDYRASGTPEQVTRDVVCGYRFARSIAPRYGGDLDAPVTAVGYSRGAQFVGLLTVAAFGPGGGYDACFSGAPQPDVLVGISGCYFGHHGQGETFSTDVGSRDAHLVLISGRADDECQARQSARAAKALTAAGYDTTLVTIPGANHYTPIFHDLVHGRWLTVPGSPAGRTTVRTIYDAIRAAE